jgi:hypothetical protein
MADPDTNIENKTSKGHSKEAPIEVLHPEVVNTRQEVKNEALTVYEAPELTLPDNPTELDRLKISIIEAVEAGDIKTAVRLQAQKNKVEVAMADNVRRAHDAARQRYVEAQKALSADDRDRNWETRKKAMAEFAEGVGKGTWKLTKFLAKGGYFLGTKTIDFSRYLLKNVFGAAREIGTEIHNGIVDMNKYRRENTPKNHDL